MHINANENYMLSYAFCMHCAQKNARCARAKNTCRINTKLHATCYLYALCVCVCFLYKCRMYLEGPIKKCKQNAYNNRRTKCTRRASSAPVSHNASKMHTKVRTKTCSVQFCVYFVYMFGSGSACGLCANWRIHKAYSKHAACMCCVCMSLHAFCMHIVCILYALRAYNIQTACKMHTFCVHFVCVLPVVCVLFA